MPNVSPLAAVPPPYRLLHEIAGASVDLCDQLVFSLREEQHVNAHERVSLRILRRQRYRQQGRALLCTGSTTKHKKKAGL